MDLNSIDEAVRHAQDEALSVLLLKRRYGKPPTLYEIDESEWLPPEQYREAAGIVEAQRKAYLQQLVSELLPDRLKGYSSQITERALWRYISTGHITITDVTDGQQTAAAPKVDLISSASYMMALALFPPEEVLMAAGNAGNSELAGIAGYLIKFSSPQDETDSILTAATLATAAKMSNTPELLPKTYGVT